MQCSIKMQNNNKKKAHPTKGSSKQHNDEELNDKMFRKQETHTDIIRIKCTIIQCLLVTSYLEGIGINYIIK